MVTAQNYQSTVLFSNLPPGYRVVDERFSEPNDLTGSVTMHYKVLAPDGRTKSTEKTLQLGQPSGSGDQTIPTYLTLAQDAAQTRFY